VVVFRHDAGEELREIAFYRKDTAGLTLGNVTGSYWTSASMASFGYTRDLAGQRRRSLDRLPRPGLADSGMKRQFQHGYDLAGRLTTEWVATDTTGGTGFNLGLDLDLPPNPTDRVTVGYVMNLVGNRTVRTRTSQNADPLTGVPTAVGSHGYDAQDRMTAFGVASPTWDARGNVLNPGSGTTYQWDRRNRLVVAGAATLGYDHEGFRVSKTTGSRRYLVDTLNPTGFGQVLAEYTGDGTSRQPVRTYTYGRDLISRRTIVGGLVAFYSADALGTTRFKTGFDQGTHATVNGQLGELTTQTFNYDAFGQLVGGNPTDTEYAFTGEEWDHDVGAYYLRARWYRPDWGRFLSRDTYEGDLEEPISQNRFLYGAANPVLYVDPSGHDNNAPTQLTTTGIHGNLQANSGSVVARQGASKGRKIACDVTYYSAKAAVWGIRISANLKRTGGHHGMQKSLGGDDAQYLAEVAPLLHRIFHSLAHKYAQSDPILKGLPTFNGTPDQWARILSGDTDGKIRAQLRNAHIRAAQIIDRLCRYRGEKSFEKLTRLSWDSPAADVKRHFDP